MTLAAVLQGGDAPLGLSLILRIVLPALLLAINLALCCRTSTVIACLGSYRALPRKNSQPWRQLTQHRKPIPLLN